MATGTTSFVREPQSRDRDGCSYAGPYYWSHQVGADTHFQWIEASGGPVMTLTLRYPEVPFVSRIGGVRAGWIYFVAEGSTSSVYALYRVRASDGRLERIVDGLSSNSAPMPCGTGDICYTDLGNIFAVAEEGGEPRTIASSRPRLNLEVHASDARCLFWAEWDRGDSARRNWEIWSVAVR